MKWKIMILVFCVCGGAALWLNGDSDGAEHCTTREIPVTDAGREEVVRVTREVLRIYNQRGVFPLERIFSHSRTTRETVKAETGVDPVKESLDVLKRNGSPLTLVEPEVKRLSNADRSFIVMCRLRTDGDPVTIRMRKTSKGYVLSEIREL